MMTERAGTKSTDRVIEGELKSVERSLVAAVPLERAVYRCVDSLMLLYWKRSREAL